jgi:hypothetical protein
LILLTGKKNIQPSAKIENYSLNLSSLMKMKRKIMQSTCRKTMKRTTMQNCREEHEEKDHVELQKDCEEKDGHAEKQKRSWREIMSCCYCRKIAICTTNLQLCQFINILLSKNVNTGGELLPNFDERRSQSQQPFLHPFRKPLPLLLLLQLCHTTCKTTTTYDPVNKTSQSSNPHQWASTKSPGLQF